MHHPCQRGITGVEKCGLVMGSDQQSCDPQPIKVCRHEMPSYLLVIGVLVRRIGF